MFKAYKGEIPYKLGEEFFKLSTLHNYKHGIDQQQVSFMPNLYVSYIFEMLCLK